VGYIQRESTTKDPQTSVITFEAATINAQMSTREGFSSWIEDKSSGDSNWCEATNLTADRAALSLCRYNSTVLDITDVIVTGSTLRIKSQEFEGKATLLRQLQGLYDDLFAIVCCDKQGRLYFEIDPQMKTQEEREDIDIVAALEHGDWRQQIELPRPQEPQTSFVNLGGVYYAGSGGDVDPILSKAPGDAPGYWGTAKEINGLILAGQTDGNVKAGLVMSRDNNEFPEVSIPTAGLWDVFDLVPQEYIQLSLAATDTKRGIVWESQKLIPRRVELRPLDTEAGRVLQVDIGVEKDSYGPAGVDGDYPDEVPEPDWNLTPYPPAPPPPPGPQGGDGNLLYFIDSSNNHLYRTRNARDPVAANVVYEDLGLIQDTSIPAQETNVVHIALDSWDPKNAAMCIGYAGIWKTTNLDLAVPTWTRVLDLSDVRYRGTMVASSICQRNLWAAGVIYDHPNFPGWYPYIYWSTDGATFPNKKHLSSWDHPCGWIKIEMSSHNAGKMWAAWNMNGDPYVSRTTDMFATYSWPANAHFLAEINNDGGQPLANPYHRYFDNSNDLLALYGCLQGFANRAITVWYTNDVTNGTRGYPGGTGETGQRVVWLAGYTWGSNRYWCLTYCGADGKWRFYISDDAINWTLQYTFPAISRYAYNWPYDDGLFYACQSPGGVANRGPILISEDRGATWQNQVGNWQTVRGGWLGDIQCCVPVWIE